MESRFVEDLLKQKGVPFNYSGHDVVVKCFNPEHDDSNPSMRIDKTTGIFNCFSCGFKGNLFKYYGILTNQSFLKVAKLKEKIAQFKADTNGLEIPAVAIPFTKNYRGISANTFRDFKAFYLPAESDRLKGFEDRVIFPISDITGKIRVFQGRHTLSSGNPKYLNYPAHTTLNLFPAVMPKGFTTMVLVEGLFDMLNCYDKGLKNVACVFGVNNLEKDTKYKLLAYKTQGITKIFIMFDGDDAGRNAARKLKPLIEACEFECEIIPLEDDSDPGSMSEEYIKSIGEYVNNENMRN